MFVSIRLLGVESIQAASATLSYFRYSVRAARNSNFADHAFVQKRQKTYTCGYQRRHHPDGPKRRCSIHDRPTCPFSADDGAYAGHWKGPRPVSYKINLRIRRFSPRTGQVTGLIVYYIAPRPKDARRGSSVSRAHDLALNAYNLDLRPSARVPSPWTVTRSFFS
jgi:hypothetical protein